MMKRRTALWIAGLIAMHALAPLTTMSCGADETDNTVGKVGTLEVTDAYARGVMDGGAVYFTVKNTGDTDDALTSVSPDVARKAGLHRTVIEGTTMKMQPVAEIAIPAKGETILEPGGYHVMLMDLKEPLEEGDTIDLVLTFQEAGSISIQAPVTPYADSDDGMDDGIDDAMDGATSDTDLGGQSHLITKWRIPGQEGDTDGRGRTAARRWS